MLHKVFTFFALFVLSGVVVGAQTPAPQPKTEPHVFSFSFDGDGGYLGVQTEEVTKENFAKLGLREVLGVAVAKVVDGSPAQAAGLQNGDVIVRLNGEEITSSRKLTRLVSEISPDHTAKLTVLRGGSEREINVTVGKRPTPKFAEGMFSAPHVWEKFDFPEMPELKNLPRVEAFPNVPDSPDAPRVFSFGNRRQIGVGLTPLTKQLSDHFGVTNGALVNSVRENSPAAKAGLKAGDIIIEIDGKAVKGEWDLIRAIGEKKEGDVSLTFVRGGSRQTIRVTPEEVKDGFFEHNFDWEAKPGEPAQPGTFKLMRPATPPTPMPLNQLMFPGRIV